MNLIYPSYYPEFCCAASACTDSCCQQWAVVVDEETASRYRALFGTLGEQLRQVMQEEDGDIILRLNPDGRCPMWRSDGLCQIQTELGEDALCHTCREFPRLRHDYGDFVELGLELSCPVAAQLILEDRACTDLCQTLPGGEPPEYDPAMMASLQRSRREILALLKGTRFSVPDALSILLLYGYRVQEELDGAEKAVLDPRALLSAAKSLSACADPASLLSFFGTLEILTPAWQRMLQDPLPGFWTESHRALARYFVKRYWLQAISDCDLISRVKLAVVSCLVVKLLGGDVQKTAQRYSKEIENDIQNVEALLDASYTHPAFADIHLLGLLQDV